MGIPWWKSTLFFIIIIIISILLFPTKRERGFLYWKSGIFDKAQSYLASRHKLAPEDLANAIRYLESLAFYGKYDLWKKEASKLIGPHPGSVALHEHVAQVYEDNLESIKAIPHWRALIRLGHNREETRPSKLLNGVPRKSFTLEGVIQKVDIEAIRDKLISVCRLTDQYEQLIEFYKEELKHGPADKDTYYALAKFYSLQGKGRKAENIFLKLLSKFPDEISAKLRLIGIYEYRGDLKKAFKIYEELINKRLADPNFILRYVKHLIQSKKALKASQILEQAIADSSENLLLKEALADTYIQLGARQKALRLYEQLYQQNPRDNKIMLNLANVYADLQNYKKAAEFLEKYHEKSQGDYRSHHLLGDMYAALGNAGSSRREYEKALKLLRAGRGK